MKKILIVCSLAFIGNSIHAQQWLPVGGGVSYQGGSGSVQCILADSIDQVLYVTGHFDSVGSVYAEEAAAWNGIAWEDMSTVEDFHNDMILFNGELYHAGDEVTKWNGNTWDLIDPYFNGGVGALIEYNNQLIAGGAFTSAGGTTALGLTVLDSNGEWQSFQGTNVTGTGAYVGSMAIYNGDLIIAGDFAAVGLLPCNNIARWDGSQWHMLGSGVTNVGFPVDNVLALGVYSNYLYVAGTFDTAGGVYCIGFAKWDGNQWYEVDNNMNFFPKSFKTSNGLLYAGGTSIGSGHAIKRYDDLSWVNIVDFLAGSVFSLDILDNMLFAGGDFIIFEASDTMYDIAQLDLITGEWHPVSFSEKIKVYPNPATDKIYLSSFLPSESVSIVNSLGQVVLQAFYNSNEPIDVSALPAGFYSLLLTNEKKRHAVSFVKQ